MALEFLDDNPGGRRLFVVQLTLASLAWVFIFLRVYVRAVVARQFTLDDWLMMGAVLMNTAYSAIALDGVQYGTGLHKSQLTKDGASLALRAWWLCEVIYPVLVMLVRASVAVFLLRIATQRVHRWIIYTVVAVIAAVTIAYTFIMAFQCLPVSYFWMNVLGQQGSCMDKRVVPIATIVHSVVSALSDWILGLLPIAMLWGVKLNKRTKVTVLLLLSLGILAGVSLIIRIPYIRVLEISADFLFETIDVAIWSVMEPSLGIIAGCAATLRPLFKTWGFGPTSTRGTQPSSLSRSRGPFSSTGRRVSHVLPSSWRRNNNSSNIGARLEEGHGGTRTFAAKLSTLTGTASRKGSKASSGGEFEDTVNGSAVELRDKASAVSFSAIPPFTPKGSSARFGGSGVEPAINVRTSIEVASTFGGRAPSDSGSERAFPLQGGRLTVVSVGEPKAV